MFLSKEQANILSDCLLAFEGGIILEAMHRAESIPPGFPEYYPLLCHLGIEQKAEDEHIPNTASKFITNDITARFSSAIWYDKIKEKTVMLAGVGGIGSYVAFLLSRMSIRSLILMDNDKVENVNMSGQLYSRNDVGNYKVNAISQMINSYSPSLDIVALPERFTQDTQTTDIMICGFDNMNARSTYFKKWKEHLMTKSKEERKHCLFIDGRLAAELLQVLCIRGDDSYNIERYEREFLFTDSEADDTVCSYKQTTYMANMIGSIIVNLFTNFVANEIADNLRPLPFFTEYNSSIMTFKLEN